MPVTIFTDVQARHECTIENTVWQILCLLLQYSEIVQSIIFQNAITFGISRSSIFSSKNSGMNCLCRKALDLDAATLHGKRCVDV